MCSLRQSDIKGMLVTVSSPAPAESDVEAMAPCEESMCVIFMGLIAAECDARAVAPRAGRWATRSTS